MQRSSVQVHSSQERGSPPVVCHPLVNTNSGFDHALQEISQDKTKDTSSCQYSLDWIAVNASRRHYPTCNANNEALGPDTLTSDGFSGMSASIGSYGCTRATRAKGSERCKTTSCKCDTGGENWDLCIDSTHRIEHSVLVRLLLRSCTIELWRCDITFDEL